jgi:hypothetical protein
MSSNRSGLAVRENLEIGLVRRAKPVAGIGWWVWRRRISDRAKRGAREKNISSFGKFSD